MRRAVLIGTALVASCGGSTEVIDSRSFNQPSAITFSCFGALTLTEEGDAGNVGDVVQSAQSTTVCRQAQDGKVEDGPSYVAFVLQPSSGSVAVVQYPSYRSDVSFPEAFRQGRVVVDADPLTPGKNAIPVGTLPVDLAADASGCHVLVANAGTCDLSRIDVTSVMKRTVTSDSSEGVDQARVNRLSVSLNGENVRSQPRAIVAQPPIQDAGVSCTDAPDNLVYIAYPACQLVAVVHAGTGEIVKGVVFQEDGTATVEDPSNIACSVACGQGTTAVDNITPRPTVLHRSNDGTRLYMGAENSPRLTIVSLDADGLPQTVRSIELEGSVGVRSIAVTEPINMGGSSGSLGEGSQSMQFAYVVTSDATVRVVEVGSFDRECDTQIDPRTVYTQTDIEVLSCYDREQTGVPQGTEPAVSRRPGARSPGIELPNQEVPLGVAFARINAKDDNVKSPAPTNMVGDFAFITASSGKTYIVNVDDDDYPDFESAAQPLAAHLPLAMAHQLRHDVVEVDATDVDNSCVHPLPEVKQRGPRLARDVLRVVNDEQVAPDKVAKLPSIRAELCDTLDISRIVSELSFSANTASREFAYPDIARIANEEWRIAWEGPLSRDAGILAIDGPQVKRGVVVVEEDTRLTDVSRPFCNTGVKPFDIAVLLGCDPVRGDDDCGLGETCFSDPSSPGNITTGLCLPESQEDTLAAICRQVLTSHRLYSVSTTFADHLVLSERRRVLRTEPEDGCMDAVQCQELAVEEQALAINKHPRDLLEQDLQPEYRWVCEPDPTREGERNRCAMICDSSQECEDGFTCSSGYCVSGILPPAECVPGLQRYELRASDAFSVVGSASGFLHNRVADSQTDECVESAVSAPLVVGRIPLQVPDCSGNGIADFGLNPCAVEVEHAESVTQFADNGTACVEQVVIPSSRITQAIRFRNPAFTLHLVDAYSLADSQCIGDNSSPLPPISTAHDALELQFSITGGLRPMTIAPASLPAFPKIIEEGPEGGLWLLDQGDRFGTTPSNGRIIRIDPNPGESDDRFSVEKGTIL